MPQYHAPLTDMQFLLHDWMNICDHYQALGQQDFDQELVNEILNQGAKFAEEVIAPLNREGDEQSSKLQDGNVSTPHGFAAAYQDYIANGWNAMLGSADYDGQDLPNSMAIPVHEMLNSANLSWRLICMLTESAVLAVTKHGSDTLKQKYLRQLISGEWTGTMCLTEPHAGTDLSLLSSKAEPNEDGSYNISGSKIFISGGDQDWSSNICHLVLARLPDAPEGVKGISLFLVPKFLVDDNGQLGERNTLSVGSIEKKMGIKACPTCVMNFDGAKGWLVGSEHKGLACMFTMMNDARFQVGLQGLGVAEASFQGALAYARERLQSRAPDGAAEPSKKADSIMFQPDVRRMLLTQKALTEGSRALAYLYAQQMDIEKFGNEEHKHEAAKVIAFLTPICKGFMTDMGTDVSSLGIQVYGGHGYIREWGMEQLMRDSRIAQLYEGTNGIQAADLISRKLARDKGVMLKATYRVFAKLVDAIQAPHAQSQAQAILTEWLTTSEQLLALNAVDLAGTAYDYMNYSAYALLGVLWLSMADSAERSSNESIKQGKHNTCAFYIKRLLPRKDSYKTNLFNGADDLLAPADNEFDYQ
ncbi:MAG: acyl-CoA dehydrogenase family protein [Paraglaciecola sp.]|uniref:acyl-CoA dehydrogenase family protein n=1 Tax=Paraglaciecola sp. TaxID=1920173 RepID=UPI00273F37C5|nr:acyl-CoA dehydrogenase family protein [Paraglaciecola sp.]MDP5029756.1 acyl-CoA dehydrogenase family protein [Paraglaciecola sp.]MDP5131627.1 acyl-CoA dehydrogenase family protein [Paraglaciecola sp.]